MDVAKVIQNSQDDSVSFDILQAKFKTYAKENFQDNFKKELDYIQYIKKNGQFFGFQLPNDKCEFFINIETVPFYWLCDFPALVKFEEWLKTDIKNKSFQLDNYKSIREFYSKWAIISSESDKKYYAFSAIKVIEKDGNKSNIIKSILHAIILSFDKRLYMPEKAIELLNTAGTELEQLKLEEWIKNEFQYLINLHTGFVHFKEQQYLEASQKLSNALRYKSNGITAKFYIALADKKLDNRDTATSMLSEVIEYDKSTLKLAIDFNSLTLLVYFVQNAITYFIFKEHDFADMLDEISEIINHASGENNSLMDELNSKITKLKELKIQDFNIAEVQTNILFLEKVQNMYRESKNTLVRFMKEYLNEKINSIIQMITDIFTKQYSTEMFEKLSKYDLQINENLEVIKHLTKEIEEHKTNHNKKLDDAVQGVEKKINEITLALENKINNLHRDKRFNPQVVFNNSMMYNLIITLVVFIIGGFSGCYTGTINDVYNFKDVMSAVIISGLKWGTVTFLAGMIISSFAAAFAFMDRANEKQNFIKRIAYLKSQKEREIELVKRDNDKKLKTFIDNFNERIDEHKNNIEILKLEKEEQFKILQDETNTKIQEQSEKLKKVLSIN